MKMETYDMRGNGDGETGDHAGRPTDYTPVVAFSCKDYGNGSAENLSPTLRSMDGVKPNGGGQMAIAFQPRYFTRDNKTGGADSCGPTTAALSAQHAGGDSAPHVAMPSSVRRLVPVECERLQGLPDGWTAIPWRGKPSEDCPDGPRYKGIGNGQAVPVMRWLAERIKREIEKETP